MREKPPGADGGCGTLLADKPCPLYDSNEGMPDRCALLDRVCVSRTMRLSLLDGADGFAPWEGPARWVEVETTMPSNECVPFACC